MLGHSVSYFLSQYWRNVPLYAEKLIPLLDTCLSNNFVYSDKMASAFYELINKYQHTEELPLENLKEFIREQGYGYILDLMTGREDEIKTLWYLLVLIHQLKGSKDGLEIVLNIFQNLTEPDRVSLLETLGEATRTTKGGFYTQKGPELLTSSLNPVGACLNGSNGTIIYDLPEGSRISGEGNFNLLFTLASIKSLGKFNTIKFTIVRENNSQDVIYENNYLIYSYPERTYSVLFPVKSTDSPIKQLIIDFTADHYNQIGACLASVKIKKAGVTYLPVTEGEVTSSSEFYKGYEADKAFETYDLKNTSILGEGSIALLYENELSAGTYTLDWTLLGGKDLQNYLNNFKIAIRYTDYDNKSADNTDNTLSVFSEDIPYLISAKSYSKTFRAVKPFNQIYISYSVSDSSIVTSSIKGVISGLGLYKDATTVTTRTIPNMTSSTTPQGSVTASGTFTDSHDAFRAFNYTNTLGCTPKSDGYIKYDYEESERPTAGDYTFTWANNSTDNNKYVKTMDAYIIYVDGTRQQISAQEGLTTVTEKTKYYYKFTALNTIKSLMIYYTNQYKRQEGGNICEVNITRTEDLDSGTNISVWYDSLPVSTENTFTVETDVDVAKAGSDFFYNFKSFINHYVYPELQRLKVKYSLEGAQAQRMYSRSKISYQSTCTDN